MDNTIERVYKAGLKFLVPLTPEETYRTIVREAMRLVNGGSGVIVLEKEGQLQTVYKASPKNFPPLKTRKKGFTYRAFKTHKSFVIHSSGFSKAHPELVSAGVQSIAFIPLAYRNKSIGVLIVRSHSGGHFTRNEPLILQLFGSMASLAIRKTQLYDEARKTLETRDLFISMAAHELRTPITTIIGYSQLLATKFPKDQNPESRWIEELCWEANRLKDLVNELLETNRIKNGHQFHYIFSECHVVEVLNRAISAFNFDHQGRKLHFNNTLKEGEDKLVGDFDRLFQMISNLLDNAAKFSPPDKMIQVTMKANTSYLIIRVKDSGYGIENKILPRIFERFYRGDKNAPEGMGLGLFLAKNIVTQHRGDINIRSKIGKGTTIEIRLPRTKL